MGRPKYIRLVRYDGNPFNLRRFLEKLDNFGMTVIEVPKRFRWRLRDVLQELYFMVAKKGEDHNPEGGEEVADRAGAG